VSGNVRAGLAGGVAALYPAFAAREFYDQMPGLYPDRLNPGVVWLGARGLLGG
jgi:hypothetical protein